MIMYFFKNVFSLLRYNKNRTILTGLGVFIGVASVIIIISFSDSFSNHIIKKASNNVTIGLVSYDDNINLTEVAKSQEVENAVLEVQEMDSVDKFEQVSSDFTVDCQLQNDKWQYNATIKFNDNVSISEGKNFSDTVGNSVIINSDFNANTCNIGDEICIENVCYTIVGKTADINADLFFPERMKDSIQFNESRSIAAFNLKYNQFTGSHQVVDDVIDYLNKAVANEDVKFVNYSDIGNESIQDFFSLFSIFLSLIASISLVVSAINIINIMYISILERSNEIAIYRSMGMSKLIVVYIFLVESFVIVLIFSILGYLFGLLVSFIILYFLKIKIYIKITNILLIFAISIIIGIGAGIKPSLKAAKTDPSHLLR